MILISHRGNITGPNPEKENSIDYIKLAMELGFEVEIDVWYDLSDWKLGHDAPQYDLDYDFLINNLEKLWIHCKNLEAFYMLTKMKNDFNINRIKYFWHQKDDFTLTSNGYIWTYPGKPLTTKSICVLPEFFSDKKIQDFKSGDCYGICSDYIKECK